MTDTTKPRAYIFYTVPALPPEDGDNLPTLRTDMDSGNYLTLARVEFDPARGFRWAGTIGRGGLTYHPTAEKALRAAAAALGYALGARGGPSVAQALAAALRADTALSRVAKRRLGFATLARQNREDRDFRRCNVEDVEAALRDAYALGLKDGRAES